MQNLGFYFELGWDHIMAWDALDHLLFVLALTAVYLLSDWKKVLILVTAFTIGHAITLVLSILDVFRFNDTLVEILIPFTIVATAGFNLWDKTFDRQAQQRNYFFAFFFGLIHGMGYANTLRFLMGSSDSIGVSLLGFNLGLEAGQVLVVTGILLAGYLVVKRAGLKRIWWVRILSAFALVMAVIMVWERI